MLIFDEKFKRDICDIFGTMRPKTSRTCIFASKYGFLEALLMINLTER